MTELVDRYDRKLTENVHLFKEGKIDRDLYWNHHSEYVRDFGKCVKNIGFEEAERQILAYFEETVQKQQWDHRLQLWVNAVFQFPNRKFIPYLTKMLQLENNKIPYYTILDLLTYIPEEIGKYAVPGLCEAISNNNPCWKEAFFQSAFQALIFIGDEQGYDFICEACHSEVKWISKWATYYKNKWLLKPDDFHRCYAAL